MPNKNEYSQVAGVIIVAAAFVVVVAGIKIASAIIIPFLLALLIATVCAPVYSKLGKYVPSFISLIIVLSLIFLLFGSLSLLISSSIQEFSTRLPSYQVQFMEQNVKLFEFLHNQGINFDDKAMNEMINPNYVMKLALTAFKGFGGLITKGFIIMLLVAFMLLESTTFTQKLVVILKDKNKIDNVRDIFSSIKRFLLIKTITSFLTGLIVYFILLYHGLDFPILWAVVAFALNFVPTIGSIIAAVPAVMLAFIQLGFGDAMTIALGYLVVNIAIGNITEPRIMGKGLGLSTLAVFLSLMFWGWVLGPVGMLLSIPLTVMVKIILNSFEQTKWIAILLDSSANGNGRGNESENKAKEKKNINQ